MSMRFLADSLSVGQSLLVAFVLLAIFAVIVTVLYRAGIRTPYIPMLGPSFIFWLELFYLALLLTAAVMYNNDFHGIQDQIPVTVGNVLPIAVPWFGALGAVVISLQGVFEHNKHWDSSYNHWHIARPIFGATLAIIGFFIFISVIKTTEAEPVVPGEPAPTPTATASAAAFSMHPLGLVAQAPAGGADLAATPLIYYVLSFLIGYREETFRALIRKATDVIIGPGDTGTPPGAPAQAPSGPSVNLPPFVDHGSVAPGSVSVADVEIKNTTGGPITVKDVNVSGNQIEWQVVEGSGPGKTWWVPGAEPKAVVIEDGSSLFVRTRWNPSSTAPPDIPSRATLTVNYEGFEGSPKTTILQGTVKTA